MTPTLDRHTTSEGVQGLMAGCVSFTAAISPRGRSGDRKERKGHATRIEGGGDVIAYHSSLCGVCQPGERHRPRNVGRCRPNRPAVR